MYRCEQLHWALLKRTYDIVGAFVALLLIAIPWLVIATVLRLEGGPALYYHIRIGRHGRPFRCYKFRTMVPDADQRLAELLQRDAQAREEWQNNFKLRDDPRITAFGEFLRTSSFDELPQFWNVLIGDMSLVGPRPVTEDELLRYGDCLSDYLAVRPGITGLWQVTGRSTTTYEERVALDSKYVREWSVELDIRILLRTVLVVAQRTGAY